MAEIGGLASVRWWRTRAARSMARTTIVPVCIAFIVTTLLPTAASACLCQYWKDFGFLAEGEVLLPQNAGGLPWWGHLEMDEDRVVLPEESRFLIERVGLEGESTPVEVEMVWKEGLLTSLGSGTPRDGLVLVVPQGGFRPGRYRFTYRKYSADLLSPESKEIEQVVSVKVSPQKLNAIPQSGKQKIALNVGPAQLEVISVESLRGGCSIQFPAYSVRVRLNIPPRFRKWRRALLHTVFVDGKIWRPSESHCVMVPPGYLSPGEREVAVVFAVRSNEAGAAVEQHGWHTIGPSANVQIVAWLPGTDFRMSASQRIEIAPLRPPECE